MATVSQNLIVSSGNQAGSEALQLIWQGGHTSEEQGGHHWDALPVGLVEKGVKVGQQPVPPVNSKSAKLLHLQWKVR